MTTILLFLLAIFIIVQAARLLVRANKTYAASVKEIELIAAKPRELALLKRNIQGQLADQTGLGERLRSRIEGLKGEKQFLGEELERLRGRRKDDLYAMERAMAPGQGLWEVTLTNHTYFRGYPQEEYVMSWAKGRTYLVSAPAEHDARKRAELKFLSSQGYKIISIQRCRRLA